MSALCVVPVTLPESWGGFATNRGLLRLDGDNLVIEFQTKDGMFEVPLSDIRQVTLPLGALATFAWKPGWFGGAFLLTAAGLGLMRDLPGGDQGRLRLKVKRADRAAAEQLATEVHLAMANRELARIESSETWRTRAAVDGPAPSSSAP